MLQKGFKILLGIAAILVILALALPAVAQNVPCYFEQGGAKFVGSTIGGVSCELELRTGTTLDIQAGNTTTFAGTVSFTGVPTFTGFNSTGAITQSDGNLTIADDLIITEQTLFTATNGVPITPTGTTQPLGAVGTVTPTISVVSITAGTHLILENTTASTITILNTGTAKLAGDIDLQQYDTLHVRFDGTNWVEVSRSDNTPTAGQLVASAVITVGTEGDTGANIILVGVQFQDVDGDDMAVASSLNFYLADDAVGLNPSTGAPSVGISIDGDGALIEWTVNLSGLAVSEADGDIFVAVEDAATPTFYLVLVMPDGSLVISTAITFA